MTTVETWRVAGLLRNDAILIQNWELFYQHLGLNAAERRQLHIAFSTNQTNEFTLLDKIIQQWASRQGRKATIQALGAILEGMTNVAAKDELFNEFSNTEAVITNFSHGDTHNEIPSNEEINSYERPAFRQKAVPRGVSILELFQLRREGESRLVIFTSYLLRLLTTIGNKPVTIISVNGKQRSGKSFLATQMVKYLKQGGRQGWLDSEMESSFKFSDDHQRVTSGIQIWHEAFDVEHNGRKYAVIVMDTQGLYDDQTGAQENAMIFGLSVLLSSVFIFNEMNAADDSLNYLRMFLEFARFASAESNSDHGSTSQLKFQQLLVLLRDYRSNRQYKFGYYDDHIKPEGQLENLKVEKFGIRDDMHAEAIATRKGIQNCFERIAVYAMSSPGNKYPDMEEYKHSSTWDEDYRYCILDFVERLCSPEAVAKGAKKVCGDEVTGEELKHFIPIWAEAIQDSHGAVQMEAIFEATSQLFFRKKIDKLTKEFKDSLEQYVKGNPLGVPEGDFYSHTENLLQNMDSKFSSGNVYGGDELAQRHKTEFITSLRVVKDDYSSLNNANLKAEAERQQRETERLEALKIEKLTKEFKDSIEQYVKGNPLGIPEGDFYSHTENLLQNTDSKFSSESEYGSAELAQRHKGEFMTSLRIIKDDYSSLNMANLRTEAERQQREADRLEAQRRELEQWNITKEQAENNLSRARNDLALAQSKLQGVINSQASYTRPVVTTRRRNRFAGIIHTKHDRVDFVFDPEAFGRAKSLAEEEVRVRENCVRDAEQNLQSVIDRRPPY